MAADGGLLAARREKDLLHFLTCGSVDDGKSTLIGRLPIRLSSGDVSERVWQATDHTTRNICEIDYEVGYGKPPRHTRFKKGEASANPRGRPRKSLAASLVEGLNKKVVVTENGRCRKIAVREAITSQLINKSARPICAPSRCCST